MGIAAALILASAVLAQDQNPGAPLQPVTSVMIGFHDGAFRVVHVASLEAILPPSDELPAQLNSFSGFWYELRSVQGQILYRRITSSPLRAVGENPRLRERVESIVDDQVFGVLLPRAQADDQLFLFSSPLEPGAGSAPATVVFRYSFKSQF
jgi:hypothetical protein